MAAGRCSTSGAFDISASVKAYFALKMIGDATDAPHMRRAREAILARGGAAQPTSSRASCWRCSASMPWRGVPVMPVEIMLLPRWFPFHLDKISYWARTVLVPLLVLHGAEAAGANPQGVGIDELFVEPPRTRRAGAEGAASEMALVRVLSAASTRCCARSSRCFPKRMRQRAIDKAVAFVTERLNGEDGLGAIFPAMANTRDDVRRARLSARPSAASRSPARSIEKLLVVKDDEAYCQPCVSPVWDTALVCHALLEAGGARRRRAAPSAASTGWSRCRCSTSSATGRVQRPDVRPGGWAFQYANPHYPDLDDTAVVVMAMDRAQARARRPRLRRRRSRAAREWIVGLQSSNGGWGAFDADNTYDYLNNIPFADHGALLDPPTADVTARCVSMLAQLGETPASSAGARTRPSTICGGRSSRTAAGTAAGA